MNLPFGARVYDPQRVRKCERVPVFDRARMCGRAAAHKAALRVRSPAFRRSPGATNSPSAPGSAEAGTAYSQRDEFFNHSTNRLKAELHTRNARRFIRPVSGFTLVELMVVIVLVSIMTALIIPEMRGTYEDALLRSTARKLVSAFNLAYSQSITLQEPHRVRIDTLEGRYLLERSPRTKGSGFVPVSNITGSKGELDNRIAIEIRRGQTGAAFDDGQEPGPSDIRNDETQNASDTIAFAPDGTAERVEVLLRDRDGFGLALRINPTTARVEIVELDRK